RREAERRATDRAFPDDSIDHFLNRARTGEGKFIHSAAMHRPRAGPAEDGESLGVFGQEHGREDAHELIRWPRRIQQRAEEIENGRDALRGKSLADWSDGLESRVIGGGEDETQAVLFDARAQLLRGEIDLH